MQNTHSVACIWCTLQQVDQLLPLPAKCTNYSKNVPVLPLLCSQCNLGVQKRPKNRKTLLWASQDSKPRPSAGMTAGAHHATCDEEAKQLHGIRHVQQEIIQALYQRPIALLDLIRRQHLCRGTAWHSTPQPAWHRHPSCQSHITLSGADDTCQVAYPSTTPCPLPLRYGLGDPKPQRACNPASANGARAPDPTRSPC